MRVLNINNCAIKNSYVHYIEHQKHFHLRIQSIICPPCTPYANLWSIPFSSTPPAAIGQLSVTSRRRSMLAVASQQRAMLIGQNQHDFQKCFLHYTVIQLLAFIYARHIPAQRSVLCAVKGLFGLVSGLNSRPCLGVQFRA